jgi:hypothetical protein
MATVQITVVDERSSSWEEGHPRFRVYVQDTGQATDVRASAWTVTDDVTGAGRTRSPSWSTTGAS